MTPSNTNTGPTTHGQAGRAGRVLSPRPSRAPDIDTSIPTDAEHRSAMRSLGGAVLVALCCLGAYLAADAAYDRMTAHVAEKVAAEFGTVLRESGE